MSGNIMVIFYYYLVFVNGAQCTDNSYTAVFSLAVNMSFLGLFIKFFLKEYSEKKGKRN